MDLTLKLMTQVDELEMRQNILNVRDRVSSTACCYLFMHTFHSSG